MADTETAPIICLDTIALVWGVQGVCRPGEEPLVARTAEYLRRSRLAGYRLAIPAPALFEYLAGLMPGQQPAALRAVETEFLVPEFGPATAVVAAELHAARFGRRAASAPARRQAAKYDFAVLGVAIACGANELLTDDEHFVEWAAGRLRVRLIRDLPDFTRLDTEESGRTLPECPPPTGCSPG